MTDSRFYTVIFNWLDPLGYTLIYDNHPSIFPREWHFIKDGIRVCCVNGSEEYYYLYKDLLDQPYSFALKTGRFKIRDSRELKTLLSHFILAINKLES